MLRRVAGTRGSGLPAVPSAAGRLRVAAKQGARLVRRRGQSLAAECPGLPRLTHPDAAGAPTWLPTWPQALRAGPALVIPTPAAPPAPGRGWRRALFSDRFCEELCLLELTLEVAGCLQLPLDDKS